MARPDYQQKLLGIILERLGDKDTDVEIEYAVKQVMHTHRESWYGVNYSYLFRALRPAAKKTIQRRKEAAARVKASEQRPRLTLTG